jgi:translation initiation factor IF-1
MATAELNYEGGHAELRIGGERIARVSGVVRLLTKKNGDVDSAFGIAGNEEQVTVDVAGSLKRAFRIAPNDRVVLRASTS